MRGLGIPVELLWSLGAWCGLILGTAALFAAVRLPVVPDAPLAAPPLMPQDTVVSAPVPSLDSVAAFVIARDLFRRSRRPAPAGQEPASPAGAPPAAATAKLSLRLVGMVAGSHSTAVIVGFPGIAGPRVVRAGDVVAGLTIVRVDTGGVRVSGMDTTWVLTMRRPWTP